MHHDSQAAPYPASDALRGNSFASGFDEDAQAFQSFVPLLGNLFEIVACFVEAALAQLPDALAAAARAVNEAGAFHHAQVFGDGLAADVEFRRQPGDGHRVVINASVNANARATSRLTAAGPGT